MEEIEQNQLPSCPPSSPSSVRREAEATNCQTDLKQDSQEKSPHDSLADGLNVGREGEEKISIGPSSSGGEDQDNSGDRSEHESGELEDLELEEGELRDEEDDDNEEEEKKQVRGQALTTQSDRKQQKVLHYRHPSPQSHGCRYPTLSDDYIENPSQVSAYHCDRVDEHGPNSDFWNRRTRNDARSDEEYYDKRRLFSRPHWDDPQPAFHDRVPYSNNNDHYFDPYKDTRDRFYDQRRHSDERYHERRHFRSPSPSSLSASRRHRSVSRHRDEKKLDEKASVRKEEPKHRKKDEPEQKDEGKETYEQISEDEFKIEEKEKHLKRGESDDELGINFDEKSQNELQKKAEKQNRLQQGSSWSNCKHAHNEYRNEFDKTELASQLVFEYYQKRSRSKRSRDPSDSPSMPSCSSQKRFQKSNHHEQRSDSRNHSSHRHDRRSPSRSSRSSAGSLDVEAGRQESIKKQLDRRNSVHHLSSIADKSLKKGKPDQPGKRTKVEQKKNTRQPIKISFMKKQHKPMLNDSAVSILDDESDDDSVIILPRSEPTVTVSDSDSAEQIPDREELLRQLKAVEQEIAKKRARLIE